MLEVGQKMEKKKWEESPEGGVRRKKSVKTKRKHKNR